MNEAFHFLRPLWLAAIPFFWLLVGWYQRRRARGGVWQQLIDDALQPFVLNVAARRGARAGGAIFALIGTCVIVALAGPTWQRIPVPVFRSESALVIALDLSSSMNAQDLEPSRLALARFKLADLLSLRKGGQSALIVFAAQSFVVTPLTDDTTTLLGHLRGLDTSIMPSQGSEPATAIALAGDLLSQAGVYGGHVLLVTDGADAEALARARSELAKHKFTLSVLGVGTAAGAPIPDSAGGFVKRDNGEIIMSSLEADGLIDLASAGGGLYLSLSKDDSEIDRLETFVQASLDDRAERLDDLAASQWHEFGPWLLLLILPFAAAGFRRGVIVCVVGMTLTGLAPSSQAAWWLTDDQQAARAFERGEFDAAAERFENPQWRASAHYRDGNYEQAADEFAAGENAGAHYNRGNALARAGRFEEAIGAYQSALDLDPTDEDAIHNKTLLEKLLADQQPEPDQGEPQDSQSGEQQEKQNQQQNGEGEDGGGQSSDESQQDLSGGNSRGGGERSEEDNNESGSQSAKQAPEQAGQKPDSEPTDDGDSSGEALEQARVAESDAERAQATEQWLRQIPDDPSGLLRRKFQYQYKQRYGKVPYKGNRW